MNQAVISAINQKKQLGQFFTKNADYILVGFEDLIKNKIVSDPFAGGGDLLEWAEKNGANSVIGYDVDKKWADERKIFSGDSIKNPRKYKFIITNPPYLNINKASQKIKTDYFDSQNFEDLYQISLLKIMDSDEGIAIVPINFLSAENSKTIRKTFFSKFKITRINYFKNRVFSDTSSNVIAFYYKKRDELEDNFSFEMIIFPENKKNKILLENRYDWTIGGDFLQIIKKQKNHLAIKRLVEDDFIESNQGEDIKVSFGHVKNRADLKADKDFKKLIDKNIILLKAIDSGSATGKIALEDLKEKYQLDCLLSKESSRHMIQLIFQNPISVSQQRQIIQIFNKEISRLREKYLSLFLTNYRDNDRKRISFDFVYKFINYLYEKEVCPNNKSQGSIL